MEGMYLMCDEKRVCKQFEKQMIHMNSMRVVNYGFESNINWLLKDWQGKASISVCYYYIFKLIYFTFIRLYINLTLLTYATYSHILLTVYYIWLINCSYIAV